MSYFVGGAVIGSAVIGGLSSKRASDQQTESLEKGMDQSAALAQQARKDVLGLFDRSAESARMGSKGAFEFYKRVAPQRMAPYLQGNRQARQAVTIGAQQANNAILGQPVDMQAINQPGVQPDTSYLEGVELPEYESDEVMDQDPKGTQSASPNINIGAQRDPVAPAPRYREGGPDELAQRYRDNPSILPERYRS